MFENIYFYEFLVKDKKKFCYKKRILRLNFKKIQMGQKKHDEHYEKPNKIYKYIEN